MFEAFVKAFPACRHILENLEVNAAAWDQSPDNAEQAC